MSYVEEVRGFAFSGREVNLLSNTNVFLFVCGFVKEDLHFFHKNYLSVTKVVL